MNYFFTKLTYSRFIGLIRSNEANNVIINAALPQAPIRCK